MTIKIVVDGEPIPAARPRFGQGRAYQPPRNREYRDRIRTAARAAMFEAAPLMCPLKANVKLYRHFQPTARNFGDVDNHLKAIFDGLNGICFGDDAQIVEVTAAKHTDKTNPRVEIELFPIDKN